MNVLLVYPTFPDSFWSFKHALPFIRKKAAYPPLGLLTVAAMLPPEWQLRLVDTNVRSLVSKDLTWADVVFISAMGIQRDSAREVISRCHEAGVRIVAGGPLFTAQPELFADVEHLVLGEAELSLQRFIEDFELGQAAHIYRTSEFADLRLSPTPRWDLVQFKDYSTLSVQFSRGCPYNCDFCDITALFGHKPRTKSVQQIMQELDKLDDLGWRGGIFFVDDNLIGNKRKLKTELLPALLARQKARRVFDFNTQASVNLADDPVLLRSMVEAGFESVFVGIETPSDPGLAECSKLHNLGRDLKADVRRIQEAGMQVQAGFIVGFDSDTSTSFDRLFEFIQATGIATAMVGLLQAIPGTRLYDRLKAAGRLLEEGTGYDVNGSTNIATIMEFGVLRARYADLISRLYSPKSYYLRVKRFLSVYQFPALKVRSSVRFQIRQLVAFGLANVRLGVMGRERFEYWKLLFWTLLRRPSSFPLAVTLAIYGYHFRVSSEHCLAQP